ncbi:branched-chain amino acid ABC transporter permease [Thermosipho ferrireducens]|uniref:Branched-chain amino acid ABC transporter permease n=1 Tax=Thermosipho ferrireducens TaxID=2571116 RepID=A0ABX7S6X3_9BACT|nr:branched-chain amino acid ABC transporter permease [Thermosipho ferrireducens]QTA38336.1 branched-chain amino acid ABC transporter permease [Thermosipho ferrireducens]
MFLQNFLNSLILGSIYVLIAIGLTIIYGVLKILHIAHAGVYALGALLFLYFYNIGMSFAFSIVLSLIISGFSGAFIYKFLYKRVLKESRIVPLIISIGLFVALQDFFRLVWGPYKRSIDVFLPIPDIITENVYLSQRQLFVLILTGVTLLGLYLLVVKTRFGKALRACADDIMLTESFGINTEKVIFYGFFLGSVLAALGGILVGLYENSVYPTMGEIPSYKAFVVIVLGGFGSIRGAIIAGFLLAIVETFIVYYFGFLLPRDAIAFLAMIAILMFKPEGLFGRAGK